MMPACNARFRDDDQVDKELSNDDIQDVASQLGQNDASMFRHALRSLRFSIVITNPHLEDNPIVYVNRAFELMTGYSSASVIGRNCRLLQNGHTEQEAVDKLRKAIAEEEEVEVVLTNYRADGTEFRNRLFIAPLHNEGGKLAYFLGVQIAEDDAQGESVQAMLSEMQHRVKNHLAMIIGLIRLQARGKDWQAKRDFDTLARRIEALQLLYEEMSGRDGTGKHNGSDIALGAYVTRVANAISHLDGRSGVRINIDADAMSVPLDTATQVGLLVSEVLTNALQHAFEGRDEGLVEVRLKELSAGVVRLTISDDGIGLSKDKKWPSNDSLGGRIANQIIQGLEAKLSVERGLSGTVIAVDIPSPR